MIERVTGEEGLFESVKRPEYTGENRCIPCTIVNLLIAVVITGVLALVSVPVAGFVFVVCVAFIYLRGYLVPYTPTFTKKYFPDQVLRLFDKHQTAVEDLDVEQKLLELGIVEECRDVDDLCITDDFESEWFARIDELDEESTQERISEVLGVGQNELTFNDYGDAVMVRVDGRRAAQWESNSALKADLAAEQILDKEPGWEELDAVSRSKVLNSLRIFLEECPGCGGKISMGQETVESCCRSIDVVAVTCEECGDRLFEAEYPG